MYPGVPSTVSLPVRCWEAAWMCASPKSSSTTSPGWPERRKRLEGLRSRWTMPWAWAVASASAARRHQLQATRRGSRALCASRWERSSPSSHSMARKGCRLRSFHGPRRRRCPGGAARTGAAPHERSGGPLPDGSWVWSSLRATGSPVCSSLREEDEPHAAAACQTLDRESLGDDSAGTRYGRRRWRGGHSRGSVLLMGLPCFLQSSPSVQHPARGGVTGSGIREE